MAKIDPQAIYVPTSSFIVWDGGRMVRFLRGRTTVRGAHPLVSGREHQFRPLTVDLDIELSPAPQAAGDSRTAALEAFAALKARARELGLAATGKKADLEAAIAEAEAQASTDPDADAGDDPDEADDQTDD